MAGFDTGDLTPKYELPDNLNKQRQISLSNNISDLVDASNTLAQKFDGMIALMPQLTSGIIDAKDASGKMADHWKKIADSGQTHNKTLIEQGNLSAQALKAEQQRVAFAERIQKATDSELKAQMRIHGLTKQGKLTYVDSQGNIQSVISSDLDKALKGPEGKEIRQNINQSIIQSQQQNPEGEGFQLGAVLGAAARMDIPGVIHAGFKSTGIGAKLGQRLGEMGARMSAKPSSIAKTNPAFGESAVVEGAEGAGLGALMGGALTKIAPLIEGALSPAGILIGMTQLYPRIWGQIMQSQSIGAITGQGTVEGWEARISALAAGANPFDFLSSKDALAAQVAVRQAGYSNEIFQGAPGNTPTAGAVADLVTDMKQKLGLPIQAIAAMVVTSLQDAGMSIDQTRAQLDSFKETVRDTGQSMTLYSAAVATAIENVSKVATPGATAQVNPAIAALSKQFAGIPGTRNLGGIFGGIIGNPTKRQQLGILLGLTPAQIVSAQFGKDMQASIDKELYNIALGKPDGMTWNGYAALQSYYWSLAPSNPLAVIFGDIPPITLAGMLERVAKQSTQPGGIAGSTTAKGASQAQASKTQAMSVATQAEANLKKMAPHSKGWWNVWTISPNTSLNKKKESGELTSDYWDFANSVSSSGLTQAQQNKILGGVGKSFRTAEEHPGNTNDLKKAIAIFDAAVDKFKNTKIPVTIATAPGFNSVINPKDTNKNWVGVLQGNNNPVQVARPPIGMGTNN